MGEIAVVALRTSIRLFQSGRQIRPNTEKKMRSDTKTWNRKTKQPTINSLRALYLALFRIVSTEFFLCHPSACTPKCWFSCFVVVVVLGNRIVGF